MPNTSLESPERRSRRLQYAIAHPELNDEQVAAIVDDQLRQEEEAAAAGKAHADSIVSSFAAMTACGCCHEPGLGSRDGLCDKCRPIVGRLRADKAGAELIGGRTRLQLATAYLDWIG